jgi:hypothetical protein
MRIYAFSSGLPDALCMFYRVEYSIETDRGSTTQDKVARCIDSSSEKMFYTISRSSPSQWVKYF